MNYVKSPPPPQTQPSTEDRQSIYVMSTGITSGYTSGLTLQCQASLGDSANGVHTPTSPATKEIVLAGGHSRLGRATRGGRESRHDGLPVQESVLALDVGADADSDAAPSPAQYDLSPLSEANRTAADYLGVSPNLCPRCIRGFVLTRYGEQCCVQCSWEPIEPIVIERDALGRPIQAGAMTQATIFDALESARRRDAAIAQADAHAPEAWKERAFATVEAVAGKLPYFAADDIWNEGLEKPHEPRALGAVLIRAVKAGICEPTETWQHSRMPSQHRQPIRVYRSLLADGNGDSGSGQRSSSPSGYEATTGASDLRSENTGAYE